MLDKVKKKCYGRLFFEKAIEELKKQNFNDMIVCCIQENINNGFYKYMGEKFVCSRKRNIGGRNLVENVYYFKKI